MSEFKPPCVVHDFFPTGSFYICNPPVEDTDRDYAVKVDDIERYGTALEGLGWTVTWDDPEYTIDINEELPFITARKDVFNLIVFDSTAGFDAFKSATAVAKHLNLTKKEDRVMLFQAVCGGRRYGPGLEDLFE